MLKYVQESWCLGVDSCIIHIDMDAFYASVEQRDNPDLMGKPVIIGADPRGRGVVSTCSYEARKYGVHSAMPIGTAYKLCPKGVYLPVNMRKYEEVSSELHEIFQRYTPLVEPISLDEAFLDVTHSRTLLGTGEEIALKLQKEVKEITHLTASVGLSYNKFLAKLASDLRKPMGFVHIHKDNFKLIVWPLSVSKIWGVGPKTRSYLEQLNIKTIGDIARLPDSVFEGWLGKAGKQIYLLSQGIDNRKVEPAHRQKSIGKEITFSQDITNFNHIKNYLAQMSEQIGSRLRKNNLKARVLTVKIRYFDFSTVTRSFSFPDYINNDKEIRDWACSIFKENWSGAPIRLIGISMSSIITESIKQLTLFTNPKEDVICETMDKIREKYGFGSIKRGHLEGK